ncbi:hypothetical protein B0H34DRAFT_693382 [Crassisporium funariophilum]|nr:hypothetical protein B0H34DRAFT_693382 [Crassisporium funariophilum]
MTDNTPSTSSFIYSDFTPAKSSRKKRKNTKSPPSTAAVLTRLREEIRQEEWFAQCSNSLETLWKDFSSETGAVLCLGLGSPTSSHTARVQLAFLAETCKRLNVDHDAVSFYDPVFTSDDVGLIEQLQMKVLTKNRRGGYPLSKPTICFMPHCDMELYESLLRANWTAERLQYIFLLGNRLEDYIDNKPRSVLETSAPCLLQLAPLLECQQLPLSSTWPTAFNNTAAQFLRSDTIDTRRLTEEVLAGLGREEELPVTPSEENKGSDQKETTAVNRPDSPRPKHEGPPTPELGGSPGEVGV